MNLYDKQLRQILTLLESTSGKRLPIEQDKAWQDCGEQNLILRSDMAYELGGGNLAAVSGIGYTDDPELVKEDEIWLYGPDLSELEADAPYARIVMAGLDPSVAVTREALQDTYSLLRSIEYERYHINPKGYMMRISVAGNREPVRIGRQALEEGLTFAKVAAMFLQAYKRHPQVRQVKIIYITDPAFPYEALAQSVDQLEKITDSLDYIFHNLKMDCSACGLQEVCNEVEGLRKLHFGTG